MDDLILDIIEFRNKYGDEATIKCFEQKILDLNNAQLSYEFARNIRKSDALAHGKIFIESKDAELNYDFARDVKGSDILAHGKAIIESKNAIWIAKMKEHFGNIFENDIKIKEEDVQKILHKIHLIKY